LSYQETLTLTQYIRPSTKIGRDYNAKTVALGNLPRIPTFIGQGVPYIAATNMAIVRCFVQREVLTFSSTAPFIAPLDHLSNGSQLPSNGSIVQLYDANNVQVDPLKWKFTKSDPSSPNYDLVQIFTEVYSSQSTYYIDYQSVDTTLMDKLPITGLRTINYSGNHAYENLYALGTDFSMFSSITNPVGNSTNVGTGVIQVNTEASYTAWNRNYTLTIESRTDVVTSSFLTSAWTAGTNTGTASIAIAATSAYTGTAATYTLSVSSVSGSSVTLAWSRSTDSNTGTIIVPLANPINITGPYGMTITMTNPDQALAGDTFTNTATSVSTPSMQVSWFSDDFTAGSGLFTINNSTSTSVAIESGILLDFGSVIGGNFVSGGLDAFTTGDVFTFEAINSDLIDWNYTRTNTQSFSTSNIYYDAMGIITGTSRSYYITLDYVPAGVDTVGPSFNQIISGVTSQATHVRINSGSVYTGSFPDQFTFTVSGVTSGAATMSWTHSASSDTGSIAITSTGTTGLAGPYGILIDVDFASLVNAQVFTLIATPAVNLVYSSLGTNIQHVSIPNKPYVKLFSSPITNISATYSYSNSPQVGQLYYVTAQYTRPSSMYNTPLVFTDVNEAQATIGLPSPTNQLGIMVDYAFNVANNNIIAVIQISSADHSGVYNSNDYSVGINALMQRSDLSDVCVLGSFDSLSNQIYNSQISNDPLYGALRLYWIGYPQGYQVGGGSVPGTIAYTSSQILQVSGNNPAHGTFISVANQWVQRTMAMENGTTAQLTLDGSFFAAMICCLQTASPDPNFFLINQVVPGVDNVATFVDTDVTILGSTSNTYALQPQNSTVVTITDAVTTDSSSSSLHEINVMIATQYVTKDIIQTCNTALIGYVAQSVDDGIARITSVISNELISLISNGVIAQYTDATGTPRPLANTDIDVWQDVDDPTRYNFNYWFNGRYGIKRLIGMYSVDQNNFLATQSS
jgi:hypothetical protein